MASIPIPSLGGLNTVLDSVEMLKRAWSSFSLPAQFTPALSVEELDKRISELKTVEQWLTLNLNMLRGSIQGLELQRGAMSAVGAMSRAMQPDTSASASATPTRTSDQADDTRHTAYSSADASGAAPVAEPSAEPAADLSSGLQAAVSPAAWWSLLQSQFSQIAQSALAATNPPAAAEVKPKKAVTRRSKAKPAAAKRRAPTRGARKASS